MAAGAARIASSSLSLTPRLRSRLSLPPSPKRSRSLASAVTILGSVAVARLNKQCRLSRAMWPHRALVRAASLMLLMFPLVTAAPATGAAMQAVTGADPHLNNLPRAAMRGYLVELSDWIMTLDLGSNHLKGNYTPASAPTHIFIVSSTHDARARSSPVNSQPAGRALHRTETWHASSWLRIRSQATSPISTKLCGGATRCEYTACDLQRIRHAWTGWMRSQC